MVAQLARITGRTPLAHIRRVAPVDDRVAGGLVAKVYDQVRTEFGMLAPPIALHAPAPPVLAASWVMLRETMLAAGVTSRAERETVAVAVSAANTCPYCVDVHTATVRGLTGAPPAPVLSEPLPAELIGVAVTFHYLNRMVNVFLRDSPLPPGLPGPVREPMSRGAAWLMGRLAAGEVAPGKSLALLPDAPPARDLSWAEDRPHVAAAMARAWAAVDAAGRRSVPPAVRDLVRGTGPDRLPDEHRAAGRLAVTVARSSYRVTDAMIDDVRAAGYDDQGLIELTAWSALTAARAEDITLSEGKSRIW